MALVIGKYLLLQHQILNTEQIKNIDLWDFKLKSDLIHPAVG